MHKISLQDILTRTSLHLALDSDGKIANFECPLDEGDEDDENVHHASIKECSCQFHSSWGLPCRHMLAVIFLLATTDSFDSNNLVSSIGDKWKLLDTSTLGERHRLLRATPVPSRIHSSSAPCLSPTDRISIMLSEFRVVADMASSSDELMLLVQTGITNLLACVASGVPIQQAAAVIDRQEWSPPQVPSQFPSKDYLQLKGQLSHKWKPSTELLRPTSLDPESREGSKLLGRYIAYKWGSSRAAGWHVALIDAQCNTESGFNFQISHPFTDKWVGNVTLSQKSYWDGNIYEGSAKHTWLLLTEQPLGADVEFINPAASNGRGKPTTARFAPPFGPTSKSWGKRRRDY